MQGYCFFGNAHRHRHRHTLRPVRLSTPYGAGRQDSISRICRALVSRKNECEATQRVKEQLQDSFWCPLQGFSPKERKKKERTAPTHTSSQNRVLRSLSHTRISYFFDWYSLKRFNNLYLCKWELNDRTIKVDPYLKSSDFSALNSEYYTSLSWFWVFGCIHRIFCIWDPTDRTVKVDTYLNGPSFPESNGKRYLSLTSFWICNCIPRVWVIHWSQKSHENGGDIFEKVWTVCVTCYTLQLSFGMQKLSKKQNWQSGCYTKDDFYVCESRKYLVPILTRLSTTGTDGGHANLQNTPFCLFHMFVCLLTLPSAPVFRDSQHPCSRATAICWLATAGKIRRWEKKLTAQFFFFVNGKKIKFEQSASSLRSQMRDWHIDNNANIMQRRGVFLRFKKNLS